MKGNYMSFSNFVSDNTIMSNANTNFSITSWSALV